MFQATRVVSPPSVALPASPSGLRRHLLTGGTALIAMLALLSVTPLQAAPDAATYASARARFQPALDGDNAAVEPAAEQLKAMSDAEPTDPVLRAYAGAATSMKARTTFLPWRKMSYAEDGLAQIDKALAQLTPAHETAPAGSVPLALETRFTAASTFLALPSMFNRGARGEQLLSQVLRAPTLSGSAPDFQAKVWLFAAKRATAAGQKDEARALLNKVVTGGTPHAAKAQQLLAGL
ncbi:MAG: hypothetical protein IPG93_10010 [Burkholderiales bacterium]|nr:hypothetical protein [Burkholderiales bacterium]